MQVFEGKSVTTTFSEQDVKRIRDKLSTFVNVAENGHVFINNVNKNIFAIHVSKVQWKRPLILWDYVVKHGGSDVPSHKRLVNNCNVSKCRNSDHYLLKNTMEFETTCDISDMTNEARRYLLKTRIVNRTDHEGKEIEEIADKCWHWTGGKSVFNYGKIHNAYGKSGKSAETVGAHVLSYMLGNGINKIPINPETNMAFCVSHKCPKESLYMTKDMKLRKRLCCNFAHLRCRGFEKVSNDDVNNDNEETIITDDNEGNVSDDVDDDDENADNDTEDENADGNENRYNNNYNDTNADGNNNADENNNADGTDNADDNNNPDDNDNKNPSKNKKKNKLIFDWDEVKSVMEGVLKSGLQNDAHFLVSEKYECYGLYPQVNYMKRLRPVHQIAMMYYNKRPLNPELMVCHRCDIKRCIMRGHLYEGTHRENSDDAVRNECMAKGEKNGNNRGITDSIAFDIRRRADDGFSVRKICEIYTKTIPGLHESTVRDIINGKTWKHVEYVRRNPAITAVENAVDVVVPDYAGDDVVKFPSLSNASEEDETRKVLQIVQSAFRNHAEEMKLSIARKGEEEVPTVFLNDGSVNEKLVLHVFRNMWEKIDHSSGHSDNWTHDPVDLSKCWKYSGSYKATNASCMVYADNKGFQLRRAVVHLCYGLYNHNKPRYTNTCGDDFCAYPPHIILQVDKKRDDNDDGKKKKKRKQKTQQELDDNQSDKTNNLEGAVSKKRPRIADSTIC